MENKTTPPDQAGSPPEIRPPVHISELKKKTPPVKSVNFDGERWVIIDELPGVLCEGTQYYDLKNIGFINAAGLASLIALLKSLLLNGVRVEFVNVSQQIRNRIKALGLDRILNCS
jgi:ABC-type transporter Mla MlaB component